MLRAARYVLEWARPTSLILANLARSFQSATTISTPTLQNSPTEQQLYANLLRICVESSNLKQGRALHAKLLKAYLPSSLYLHNHALNMYVKCGQLNCSLKLFDEMPQKNVVSWSAMIAGFVQQGCPKQALSLFSRMHCEGTVRPNEFTLVSVLHAGSLSEDLSFLYQVYGCVVRLGYESNVFLVNAFLTGLMRHGKLLEAKEVFHKCLDKDIVSWNAMMAGLLQYSYAEIPRFWCQMRCEGVKPDSFTFATVLTGLAVLCDRELGLRVHALLVKSGHGGEICVGNSLCDLYIKNRMPDDGFKAFSEMPCTDVCSWTQMAAGYLLYGEPGKTLDVVEEMRQLSVKPNKFTLATALNACANLASLEEGKKFHGLRIKFGSEADQCVDNALLDVYMRCGCVDAAWVVFRSMPDHSVVSWTTMIMGCAQNGQAREALEIFEEMKRVAAEPNYITFICVLYACCKGGFVEEGWKYFTSMFSDHGITPGEDHYVCLVNLLGRAGRIKEAEEVILTMPFQAGVLVWQTLLGACQLYGDIETGKRAAERAMNLDGKDPSTYVLMSNMFAGLNNWRSVEMLRKLMENRDVKKMPGSSWIEVDDIQSISPASRVVA